MAIDFEVESGREIRPHGLEALKKMKDGKQGVLTRTVVTGVERVGLWAASEGGGARDAGHPGRQTDRGVRRNVSVV